VVVKFVPVLTGSLVALALGAGSALAQAPAAAGAQPPPPEVKNVGDWAVRCFPVQNAHPCDMFQEQGDTKTNQRLLSISIAYVPQAGKSLAQISVPLEVFLPRGLSIQADGYTSPVMKYRMCTREGCFVQTAVDEAFMDALAKATNPTAKVNIAGDDGKSYALTFSLKGFAAARDEVMNESRAKAKSTPQAAKPAANP
jgi:invasion protein IalB